MEAFYARQGIILLTERHSSTDALLLKRIIDFVVVLLASFNAALSSEIVKVGSVDALLILRGALHRRSP